MITRKRTANTLKSLILVLLILPWLGACTNGTDDTPAEPTAQEVAFEKIAGTWTFGSSGGISVDGQNESANYPNFSLTISEGTYNTTNAGELFSATGTWEWLGVDAIDKVVLEDGKVLSIAVLTETNFEFSFAYTNNSGGVIEGISGNYTVALEK